MSEIVWWVGALHVAVYAIAGGVWLATWLMHRTLKHLKLWSYVFQGLKWKRESERAKG